jgi:hypothetical protein
MVLLSASQVPDFAVHFRVVWLFPALPAMAFRCSGKTTRSTARGKG